MTADEILAVYAKAGTKVPDNIWKWITDREEGMSKAFANLQQKLKANPPIAKKISIRSNFSFPEYKLNDIIDSVKKYEKGTGLTVNTLFPKNLNVQPNVEVVEPELNYKGLDKYLGVLSFPVIARSSRNGAQPLTPQDASKAVGYARRLALATILNISSKGSSNQYNSYGNNSNSWGNNSWGNNNWRNRNSSWSGNRSRNWGNQNYRGNTRYTNQGNNFPRQNTQNQGTNFQRNNGTNYQNNNGGNRRNFSSAEASPTNTTNNTQTRASASPKQSSASSAPKAYKKLSSAQLSTLKTYMNKLRLANNMTKPRVLKIVRGFGGMTSSQSFPSQFPASKYSLVINFIKSNLKPKQKISKQRK